MFNITNFSVKNYQFTLVMFLMVAVVGVATLLTMPRAEDPQINPPSYNIVVVYPGTSPQDMEELVVKPIETEIFELEDIDKIVTNIEDGLAIIQVDFKYGVGVDNKYQEVVREVNALSDELPENIFSIDIGKIDPSDVNILQMALVSETAAYRDLNEEADRLVKELEKVKDLKKIEIAGVSDEIVRVDMDVARLAKFNIPLNVIVGSIQSEDANIPGGSLNAGTKSFNVKTSGKFIDLADIESTVVYNSNGTIIELGDVADVKLVNDARKHITRLNGFRCVLVNAALKEGSNISLTASQYEPILANYEKGVPENMKFIPHFDQAKNVEKRLSGLGFDFALAIILVLFTLLPLGIRASLIVMISIPLSLALGLVGLNLFDISLNQLSIVGLVVALGLLVDDSIVVVENIERWLRDGYSRAEASIKATKQISLAVIGCTATLIIAFLPLIFLPGGPGEFVRGLPMAVITSVFASMIVSLTVVPFLGSRLLSKNAHPDGNVALRLLQRAISATYAKLVKWALGNPVKTLIGGLLLFVASLSLFPVIGFKLFPVSEKPIFLINVKMPQQTNLLESNRIAAMIEDSLEKVDEIVYFTTNVGKGNPRIYYNVPPKNEKTDFAQFFIQLDEDTPPKEKTALIENLRAQFATFPYAKVEVNDFVQGPPIEAPISVRIFGDDIKKLRELSFEVENILKANDGTVYVDNELNTLKTDVKVAINRQKARTLGLLTADIDRTIRLAIAGVEVGSYTNDDGDEYDILLNVPRQEFPNLDVFKNLYVNNVAGTPIALNQFADITFESSPTSISHFNKARFAKVNANTKKGILANDVLKDVVPQLDAFEFPDGYYYKLSGEAESEDDAIGGDFIIVILITVFLFIAVLILQFKTFKGTLIVLSVIPLGVVGGVTMLFLSGNPMSFIAIIGFIGLAGIEVKNSILLVDFTNQLRAEGMGLIEAIEKAGELRFLPVVLTSLTAIGGLTPLALNANPQISPLALVLIGGLISSTLLSRIITPVMYKIIPPTITK